MVLPEDFEEKDEDGNISVNGVQAGIDKAKKGGYGPLAPPRPA